MGYGRDHPIFYFCIIIFYLIPIQLYSSRNTLEARGNATMQIMHEPISFADLDHNSCGDIFAMGALVVAVDSGYGGGGSIFNTWYAGTR